MKICCKRVPIPQLLAVAALLVAPSTASAQAQSPYSGFRSVTTEDNQFIALNELVCPENGTPDTTFELRIRAFRTNLKSHLMPCKLQAFTGLMGTAELVRDRYFNLDNQNRTYDLGVSVYLPNIEKRPVKNSLLFMTLLDPNGARIQQFKFKSWSTFQRKYPFFKYHLKRLQ